MENPRPHPTQSFIIWRGACVELKKTNKTVSIESRVRHVASTENLELSPRRRVPFIGEASFMPSLFGKRAAPTDREDSSRYLLWTLECVTVVNPMIVFTVSKYNQGVAWCSREGWYERGCVCLSTQRRLRPRWGWRPCCSAYLEAETT